MKVGYALPAEADVGSGASELGQLATAGEAAGFDSLWVMDQVTAPVRCVEPTSLLAFLSGVTHRVTLGTAVVVAGAWQPLQLARALTSAHWLSGGRVIAGLALGPAGDWLEAFDVVGGKRRNLEAALDALARHADQAAPAVMTEDPVNALCPPSGVARMPVYLGGRSEAAVARAVARADGWISAGLAPLEEFRALSASVRGARARREEVSGEGGGFVVAKRLYVHVADRGDEMARVRDWFRRFYGSTRLADDVVVYGDEEHCRGTIAALGEEGTDLVIVGTIFDHRRQLERLAPAGGVGSG